MGGYFSSLLRHTGHSIISKTNSSIASKHGTEKLAYVNSSDFGVNIELESRDSGREIKASGEITPDFIPLANGHPVEPAIVRPPFHVYTTDESQLNAHESIHASFPERDEKPITWKEELTSEPEVLHYKPSQIPETEKDSQRVIAESYPPKFSHASMHHRDEEPTDWKEQEVFKTVKHVQVPPQVNESQQISEKASSEEWHLPTISKTFDFSVQDSHKSDLPQTSEPNNHVHQSQRIFEKTSGNKNPSQAFLSTIQSVIGLTLSDTPSADNHSSNHIPLDTPRSLDLPNNHSESIKEKSDPVSLIQEIHTGNSKEMSGRKMPVQEKPNSFSSQNEVSGMTLKSNGRTEVGTRNVRESLSLSIGTISITVEEPKEAVPPRIIQIFENSAQDETSSRLNRHYVRIR